MFIKKQNFGLVENLFRFLILDNPFPTYHIHRKSHYFNIKNIQFLKILINTVYNFPISLFNFNTF